MRDPGVVRHPAGAVIKILPGLAAILGDMQAAVIGANPDHPFLYGAGGNCDNGGVKFGSGDIGGKPAAFIIGLPIGIVGGQIAADNFPA